MSFMTDMLIYSARSIEDLISNNHGQYKVFCTLLGEIVEVVGENDLSYGKKDICLQYNKNSIHVIEASDDTDNAIIIRCKEEKLKEILLKYFSSDRSKVALKCIQNEILKLPLFIDRYSDKELLEYVDLIVNKQKNDLLKRQLLTAQIATSMLSKTVNNPVFERKILETGLLYKEKKSLQCIIEDVNELNACYKAKAYKATLILAGSILEAFLIDWISEIHKKDYFKYSFIKELKDDNGRVYVLKNALAAYIEEIKDINKPDWMDEAYKANEIREKRNLVHARCCLKDDVKINGETCKMVIDYLKDIINTRYVKKFGMSYEDSVKCIYTEEKWEDLKWNYEDIEKFFLNSEQ